MDTREREGIRYRSVYTVDVNGDVSTWHDRTAAAGFIVGQIRNGGIIPAEMTVDDLLNLSGDKAFVGHIGIHWDEDEDVPASPFDAILVEYQDRLHGMNSFEDMCLDRNHRFVMVEENRRGGHYLTTSDSIEGLMTSHDSDEYADDWELVGIYRTTSGDEVNVEVHTQTTYEVKQ